VDLSQSPLIFAPVSVLGHWCLVVIQPRRPRGSVTILSSRRRYGHAMLKRALRVVLDRESPPPPISLMEGVPIVTWEIHVPFSPREMPRSNDGGVYLLLHLAGYLSDTPVHEETDTSRVRVLLAGLLAPLPAGLSYNYFGSQA
jgi:Ulp1 family protease